MKCVYQAPAQKPSTLSKQAVFQASSTAELTAL